MKDFNIIGTGPGGRGNLTFRAFEIINSSDILVGSRRAVATVNFIVKDKNPKPEIFYLYANREEMLNLIQRKKHSHRISLLVTGDAGFHSMLHFMAQHFEKREYEIHPGISSVQLAASRLGVSWHESFFYSIHGRDVNADISNFKKAFIQGRDIYVLTDNKRNPIWFAGILEHMDLPLESREIVLFLNLDYQDEEIIHTDFRALDQDFNQDRNKLCIMLIRKKRKKNE